ncbi:MAG: sugar-binding domain-containing protein [Bryobacteraceae bacterium]
MRAIVLAAVFVCAACGEEWRVRVEEPTGLYRRTDEVVAIPLGKFAPHGKGFTVLDPQGKEVPHQVAAGELLFPVSVMPGELPEYRVRCCREDSGEFPNPIVARRTGMRRVEFGNGVFRAVIDTGAAAIVEAYTLRADEYKRLNLVELTPEERKALEGDIHEDTSQAAQVIPPAVPGVEGPNTGWTSLGGSGAFAGVEILESGPLRGRIRLSREGEAWEIVWHAGSAAFRWRAGKGFRFASVSASPYLPFDRCADGSEYRWPTGPGGGEPPFSRVGPRAWKKLPGGHMVYWQKAENYGALGIVTLDENLDWKGACSRRFVAEKGGGDAEIAVTFPQWRGGETVLEARREFRMLTQPALAVVTPSETAGATGAEARRAPQAIIRAAEASPFEPAAVSLDGEWELMWAEKGLGPPKEGWRNVRVPGTVHVQWLPADQIYTRAAEWISRKEWWYRRDFEAPRAYSGKRIFLQFDATDYYADVYLNGRWLARHEGYIDPWEVEIPPGVLREGRNQLAVRVWTPVHYYWKHRPYTVKGSYGAVDQKPDDITALGITRSVRLRAYGEARVTEVAVNTRLKEGGAEVEVELEADGETEGLEWELTLKPANFEGQPLQVRSPYTRRVTIPVRGAKLWWTWDTGTPHLYWLDVRLLDGQGQVLDGRRVRIGIREIEKTGWNFYLNRRKLFIRGTNYYYHLFLSEMDRRKYERDMELMLGMNVNMIRLHCHFTNPEFYDLADERGVLLWQDFLEAWYPHDRRFSQRAAMLYDNHLRYVRNHPSVALWATSDEEDFENYRDLTKHLAARPFFLDPQRRPVVRSTGRFGDSHVYYGWYGGSIWEYAKLEEEFVSELGATALPNYETLKSFMDGKWPFTKYREEWEWRRLQVPEALRAWGDPEGFTMEEFIPRTQAYVARLFQLAIERMRRRKAEGAGGILHFHAIDIWPSVTMAAIDFERRPTKVYDTVRRSFAPVGALFEYDRDRWRAGETVRCAVWAVNDLWQDQPGLELRWRIEGGGGAALASGVFRLALEADSVKRAGVVEWRAGAPGSYRLVVETAGADGKRMSENIFEFEVTGQ